MVPLIETVRPKVAKIRAGSALLGPAFVAAIAYVDPGNVATNITAGSAYGYLLVWVIVLANTMAALVQYLSAKLGLVTGKSLPEAIAEGMSRPNRLAYWAQAEIVAAATDLAEVIGGAIALRLLFGLPLVVGGVITGLVSMVLLAVQDRRGQAPFERVITGLLLVIAVGFIAGVFVSPPSVPETLGGLLPRFRGSGSVLLAAGILGATVMPHAIYLHSALARDRHGFPNGGRPAALILRVTRYDVAIAMVLAGAVNLAMLLLAARNLQGLGALDSLDSAHAAVGTALGSGIALLFAIGLLASGFASTSVGCYAGAVIMQGLLNYKVPILLRRLITLIPALVILAVGIDPTKALVISQVVLSFGIPFALLPLVRLTAKTDLMGEHRNARPTTVIAWTVAGAIVALNCTLIYLQISGSG